MFPQVSRAGEWFLRSGIQTPEGGVARYYRLDQARNHAVSTEITGYFVSTLVYLHGLSSDVRYLDRALSAARFLDGVRRSHSAAIPFEIEPPALSYFFDCGIIVRGLLSAWRASGEPEFLLSARAVGDSMISDFDAPGGRFHPVLALPGKKPLEWDDQRWSRSPGCYQLKAGLAWRELWEATGENRYRESYENLARDCLRDAPGFLPGHPDPCRVVDRLHAFLYFLEGLLPLSGDELYARAVCQGVQRVEGYLREYAAEFERSDVYAQLLRMRLLADHAGIVPLDRAAGEWEVDRLQEFAVTADDPKIEGGFYFGRTAGRFDPYVNPVSTAFALQALALWHGSAPAYLI